MAVETVYSSAPLLSTPRRLAASVGSDLRVVPSTAWTLFVRGVQARYRQSRLGYVWLFLPAVASTLTWVYLAHRGILVTGETAASYTLYVLTGTLLFQLFLEALTAPLRRLSEATRVLAKSRLPHESWILAGALDALFGLAVRSSLFAIVLIWTGTPVRAALLLAPLGVLALVLLGLAIGLLLAPAGLLYGDVSHGLTIAAGLWFFLTPVIYPQPHSFLVELNPVTPLLVTTRAWMIGGETMPVGFAAVLAGSVAVLGLAWLVYRVAQPHLVEHLG